MNEEILTAREVAGMLKVSRRMVYALHAQGVLTPSHQLPAAYSTQRKSREGWRWRRSDVEHFLARCAYRPTIALAEDHHVPPFVPVELPERKYIRRIA